MNPIESSIWSPFDEALARQQLPLLSMEEKNELCEEMRANSHSSHKFSSLTLPWKYFGPRELPASSWNTQYRNDAFNKGSDTKCTHTIEFTESNSITSTKHFDDDNKVDEEQGFTYALGIDHQGPSPSSTLSQRMRTTRIAIAIILAGTLLFRLMA
jgi:hypothetical protein